MKKCIITLVVALMAIGAEAQVTWNVRLGGGIMENGMAHVCVAPRLSVQSNIPLSSDLGWVFSPTLGSSVSIGADYYSIHVDFPLLIGYKAPIGRSKLFIPKIGPVFGFNKAYGSSAFIVGPSAELAFEIGHFVVAFSGYYSFVKRKYEDIGVSYYWDSSRYQNVYSYYSYEQKHSVYNASLTLGYKF